jgi:hypothetical protein
MLAELKRTRVSVSTPSARAPTKPVDDLEKAKQMGKFRPIGAPPLLSDKNKADNSKPRKKKKKILLVESPPDTPSVRPPFTKASSEVSTSSTPPLSTMLSDSKPPEPSSPASGISRSRSSVASAPPVAVELPPLPLPIPTASQTADEDDIFAGAGDYDIFASDQDDDNDHESEGKARESKIGARDDNDQEHSTSTPGTVSGSAQIQPRGWFGDDSDLVLPSLGFVKEERKVAGSLSPNSALHQSWLKSPCQDRDPISDRDEETQSTSIRLQPLVSSSTPSINALLEADRLAELDEKRLARKLKRKAGTTTSGGGINGGGEIIDEELLGKKKKMTQDQKVQRDFQQYVSLRSISGRIHCSC